MNSATDEQQLLADYREAQRELRRRHAAIGCLLAIVLMPTGSGLDWALYPQLLGAIALVRVLCAVALVPPLLLLLTSYGKRYVGVLSSLPALIPMLAICWMIAISDRELSPYYAGLMLMMVVVCQLLPYTFLEALGYCATVTVCYLAACVFPGQAGVQGSLLFNNLFFLVTTSVVCATVCHLNSIRRYNEFRLRYELDARNRQLQELDRLKTQFFANVSHELRTPLTLIIAPVDQLLHRRPPLPQEAGQSLQVVRKNALRLLDVINDLLEIVRLEEGKTSLRVERLDLATFLSGMVDAVRAFADKKRLNVSLTSEHGSLIVAGDEARLEKVILNLLSNAIKFTPADGQIDVRLAKADQMAQITVSDSGIGIPHHEHERVFERFHQASHESVKPHHGLGIGLALARELVEEHRGTLTLESTAGKGSTFTVALPISDDSLPLPSADSKQPPDETLAEIFQEARHSGLTTGPEAESLPAHNGEPTLPASRDSVLVIDDEPDMLRFLISVLDSEFRVLAAADGETGLQLAHGERPSVVLLDFMLPGIDGLEVCKAIRRENRLQDTKVLMLTVRVDEGAKIESLRCGADDFLTKPFNSIEVKTRVHNLMATFRLQQQLRQRNQSLHEALEQLKSAESQLVQSEKMNALGSLAAGLLHEINNPLNYTLLAIAAAKQDAPPDDEELGQTLGDIEEGLNRIHGVIGDLRTFAHPEQSNRHTDFDLAAAIDTATKFTAHECGDIDIRVSHAGSPRVHGSPTQITQLLVNMLSNAANALHDGRNGRTAIINIETECTGPAVEVRVSDNGPGIDDSVRSKIFDPFFTTRDVGQGIGLGLSVCSTIATNHGSSIEVKSAVDRGTTFTFRLPHSKYGS